MLRILTPNGMLREVEIDEIIPVYEKRVDFNGSTWRLTDKVNPSTTQPNGLAIRLLGMDLRLEDEFFVGNLRPETVREIMQKLLKDEYFDFTEMSFQPRVTELRETVLDDAKSLPYVSEYVSAYINSGVFENNCCCSIDDPFCKTTLPMSDIGGFCGGTIFDNVNMPKMQNGMGVGTL